VYDARAARLLAHRTSLGAASAAKVGDAAGEGCFAGFRRGGTTIAISRPGGATAYTVRAEMPGLEVNASLESTKAPAAITAIARVDGGGVNTTEKRALLAATGEAIVGDQRISLDGAFAGYDYTHGALARHTRWRWAFALGKTSHGEPFAMNLVEGFVGEAECAAWIGSDIFPLAEGRFAFDADKPLDAWRVTTADEGVDLRFTPGDLHAEKRNLILVASRFIQPCGTFSGTLHIDGKRDVAIDRALGVTEDQDVLW
jgi:hypothetical protein